MKRPTPLPYFLGMEAVKVDHDGAVRLGVFRPGDCYEAEIVSADEIKLHRIPPVEAKVRTHAEVIRAIEASSLHFNASWDEVKRETRE